MTEPETPAYEAIAAAVFPKVLELGHVAMQFAQVERGTGNLSGNHETDTDHTVMLGLTAMALAEYDPRLDQGLVAQYALVHDLVEVYAGDTVTMHQDRVDFAAKAQREAAALEKLRQQFGQTFPGFIKLIDDYEDLADLESQFVKTLDKSMPAITHIFNGGWTLDGEFESVEQLRENSRQHTEKLAATYGADHPLIIALRTLISTRFIDDFAARHTAEGMSA